MNETKLLDVWRAFSSSRQCSVDRMICNPQLRIDFLAEARRATALDDEEEILWQLMAMRKKKALTRC